MEPLYNPAPICRLPDHPGHCVTACSETSLWHDAIVSGGSTTLLLSTALLVTGTRALFAVLYGYVLWGDLSDLLKLVGAASIILSGMAIIRFRRTPG